MSFSINSRRAIFVVFLLWVRLGSGDIVTVACPEEFVRSSGDTRFKCGHGLHGRGQWWLGPFLGERKGKISGSGGHVLTTPPKFNMEP